MTRLQTRRRLLLSALLALAAAHGCATPDTRLYARQLDPLIGKADKDFFIEKYGDPVARDRVDSHIDVWEFVASERPLNDRPGGGNLTMITRLRLTFKDGILSAWQASNSMR
jgi:hypothetical protein